MAKPKTHLTKCKRKFNYDKDDRAIIIFHDWYINNGHIVTKVNGRVIRLERMLMGNPKNRRVIHKNGDKTDNTRKNLRTYSIREYNLINKR